MTHCHPFWEMVYSTFIWWQFWFVLVVIQLIANEKKLSCVSVCPAGREGTELQQPNHPLPLSAHLHYGYHHAMLPIQCILQSGQPGSSLLRHCLFHPLPPTHLLLCLARPHHQRLEDPGGECNTASEGQTHNKQIFLYTQRDIFTIIKTYSTSFDRVCYPRLHLALGQSTCLGMKNRVWVCSGTTSRPAL